MWDSSSLEGSGSYLLWLDSVFRFWCQDYLVLLSRYSKICFDGSHDFILFCFSSCHYFILFSGFKTSKVTYLFNINFWLTNIKLISLIAWLFTYCNDIVHIHSNSTSHLTYIQALAQLPLLNAMITYQTLQPDYFLYKICTLKCSLPSELSYVLPMWKFKDIWHDILLVSSILASVADTLVGGAWILFNFFLFMFGRFKHHFFSWFFCHYYRSSGDFVQNLPSHTRPLSNLVIVWLNKFWANWLPVLLGCFLYSVKFHSCQSLWVGSDINHLILVKVDLIGAMFKKLDWTSRFNWFNW